MAAVDCGCPPVESADSDFGTRVVLEDATGAEETGAVVGVVGADEGSSGGSAFTGRECNGVAESEVLSTACDVGSWASSCAGGTLTVGSATKSASSVPYKSAQWAKSRSARRGSVEKKAAAHLRRGQRQGRPWLWSRSKRGIGACSVFCQSLSIDALSHGGPPTQGRGVAYVIALSAPPGARRD